MLIVNKLTERRNNMFKKFLACSLVMMSLATAIQPTSISAMDSRVSASNSYLGANMSLGTAWAYGYVTSKDRHYANVELNDYLCTKQIRSGRKWGTGKVNVETAHVDYDDWNCKYAYLDMQLWTKIYYGFN